MSSLERTIDIHKAGAIIIQNRKILLTRSFDKTVFVLPGGKLEPGESPRQALIRELAEELTIQIVRSDFRPFGTFYDEAATDPGRWLKMDVFLVKSWRGTIAAAEEIEAIKWVTSTDLAITASIYRHHILPRLLEANLVD